MDDAHRTSATAGSEDPAHPSHARGLIRTLADLGVTHLVGLPDNTSAPLFASLSREGEGGEGDPAGIRLVTVTREGEGIALASGLWLGGARPAVVIQNTGLLEAGDGLRGTASRMGAPLLLLITCRGYPKARALGLKPGATEIDRDLLVRPDLDSVAFMTEQTLRAWGIPFTRVRDVADEEPIRRAWTMAGEEERPVAVLVEGALS
jgi:sulfopyruvate decarboxylase subunit alpha